MDGHSAGPGGGPAPGLKLELGWQARQQPQQLPQLGGPGVVV